MLEAIRQNSRSAIIYILFGILIAAFIISFGPGSFGASSSDGRTGGLYAAKVAGSEIGEQDFHFAYVALGGGNLPGEMARQQRIKEFIMDRLIERELLAQEAERLGLAVSEEEANKMVADGRLMVLGMQRRIEPYAFKDGALDYERLRMVAQNHYGLTIKRLLEVQRRELLADKTRELTRIATKVSPDEVKADFIDKGRQVDLSYVRFSPRRFEEEVNLSDTEIENWARAHEAEVKKAYEERKAYRYQKQDQTVHLRRILIKLDKDAKPEKVKEAEGKLAAALATIKSGTRFGDVARTVSEDTYSRPRGGDMGWLKKGFTGLGPDADPKVFSAKEGELVGPLRTEGGLELLKVEGFRQGDVGLGAARTEIAEELLRDEKMKELAKAAAKAAADKVKAGARLAELFPKTESSDADEARVRTVKENKIQVEETGLFSRRGDVIQGVGSSAELAKQAFSTLKVGDTVGPLEISMSWVVATVKEKKEPDMAEWEKRKAEIIQEDQRKKWAEVLSGWSKERCTEVNNAGRIKINPDILTYEGGPPKDIMGMLERKYEPCSGRL